MKARHLFFAGMAGAGTATLVAYAVYLRRRRAALRRLLAGSRVLETGRGPLEYADMGQGPAVLVLHGGGGGYDQGSLFARPDWGLRFIAPSRPGYLRTPLWVGRTFEEQADALAAMLDVLEIANVAVVGTSAGGPPALQLALRHPGRCRGLVLISAANAPLADLPAWLRFAEKVTPSDFLTWALLRTQLPQSLAGRMFDVGTEPEKKMLLQRLLGSTFPVSVRLSGAFNDLRQMAAMPSIPLEDIAVPALVIHGDGDSLVPFAQGRRAAGEIPGAQFLVLEGGDHLAFVSHMEQVWPAMRAFLLTHAAQ